MSHVEGYAPQFAKPNWFARAEAWLDRKGKGAWIAASVLGLIFVWPVGLAIAIYAIWSKKMFSSLSCHQKSYGMGRSSGNRAFDAYKAQTIERLAQEQQEFEAFMQRLRDAKDKAEFDQFIKDRDSASKDA